MEQAIIMKALSNKVCQNPSYFIAFGFGSGLSPIAPGTFGTLAAIPFYLLLSHSSWLLYSLITIAAFALGVMVSDSVSKDMGEHDYKGIVWDEFVGYFLTMFMAPKGGGWVIIGFILFRFFDIWKPQPIRWVDQRVHGGMGIMLDDVIAAIPAWIILQSLAYMMKGHV